VNNATKNVRDRFLGADWQENTVDAFEGYLCMGAACCGRIDRRAGFHYATEPKENASAHNRAWKLGHNNLGGS